MTQDEIIEMAKSINEDWWLDDIDLKAFAKLVAEREREACAKIADELHQGYAHDIAMEIRARGTSMIEEDDDIQDYKKPWQPLNWGEVPEDKTKSEDFLHGARWAEKQLKERNA